MPVKGAKPKPQGQAITRHKPLDWTEVPNVPFTDGPNLPATRRNGDPWSPAAADKWRAWASMPHCAIWTPADWQFAFDAIEVAASFMVNHDASRGAELRNREKVMGTTVDYRRDIRVRYVDPAVGEVPADVARLDDYRSL